MILAVWNGDCQNPGKATRERACLEDGALAGAFKGDRSKHLRQPVPYVHPHELPELIAVEPTGGLPAPFDRIATETRAP